MSMWRSILAQEERRVLGTYEYEQKWIVISENHEPLKIAHRRLFQNKLCNAKIQSIIESFRYNSTEHKIDLFEISQITDLVIELIDGVNCRFCLLNLRYHL